MPKWKSIACSSGRCRACPGEELLTEHGKKTCDCVCHGKRARKNRSRRVDRFEPLRAKSRRADLEDRVDSPFPHEDLGERLD